MTTPPPEAGEAVPAEARHAELRAPKKARSAPAGTVVTVVGIDAAGRPPRSAALDALAEARLVV
ncbi:hypothetical protein, partial [Micromonospora globispora]